MIMCAVCGGPCTGGMQMCRECCKSYDRYGFRDVSVLAAIVWAARRARRYEQKRQREKRSSRAKPPTNTRWCARCESIRSPGENPCLDCNGETTAIK